jgi:hypothetical protein
MANKFQKSLQERQNVISTTAARPVAVTDEWAAGFPDSEPESSGPKSAINIENYLRPSDSRMAKNKTFYLDEDVIAAVRFAAKTQRMTDSKMVNDILRTVLMGQK